MIIVSQRWAYSRVIVDDEIVYDKSDSGRIPYHFTAGEHLIEVEHSNVWHTASLRVDFSKQLLRLTRNQVQGELQRADMANLDVYYVVRAGQLESGHRRDSGRRAIAQRQRLGTKLVRPHPMAAEWPDTRSHQGSRCRECRDRRSRKGT